MQLFENISMMLSQHGPLIKNTIVLHIHWHCHMLLAKSKEIDLQVGIIADTFYDLRRLDKHFQDIKLYSFPVLTRRLAELKITQIKIKNQEELVLIHQTIYYQ